METIYNGPHSKPLIILKRISAMSLGATVAFSPIMTLAPNASPLFIASMIGTALAASGLSTAMIHYCVKPYVSQVKIAKKDIGTPNPLLYIHTLSFLGKHVVTMARVHQLETCNARMFANFKLKETKRHFFVHDALIGQEDYPEFRDIWTQIKQEGNPDWNAIVNQLKK